MLSNVLPDPLYAAMAVVVAVVTVVVAIPMWVFAIQVALGSIGPRRAFSELPARPSGKRVVVLVPAHNESANLLPTLHAALRQLQPHDRLIVVADNCSDDTAQVARGAGVDVVERKDLTKRGKGYALDFGWQYACSTGPLPDFALILDADCILDDGCLDRLVAFEGGLNRPVQALYLCHHEGATGAKQRIGQFAWTVKNWARALGYARLGLPCQLMGSGMLIPQTCLAHQSLASGHLVEDLQLGLALAARGMAPRFCESAKVTSAFPNDVEAQASQRTRWEHGHLSMIASTLPGVIRSLATRPNVQLAALGLDLAVPPLTLLLMLAAASSAFSIAWGALSGDWWAAQLAAGGWVAVTTALALAWWRYGRDTLRLRDVMHVALYVAWKVPMYVKFLVARQTDWVRTKRDG